MDIYINSILVCGVIWAIVLYYLYKKRKNKDE